MANNPKKMDPTEAALSAIQEALNIRDDDPVPLDSHLDGLDEPPLPPERGRRTAAPAVPVYDEPYDPEPYDPRMEAHGLRAANDDQRSIGEVLQALQRRPAHTSYIVAAVFSVAWVIGCVALSWAYLSDLSAALGPGHSPVAIMIGLGAGALLPIIFFFGVAHMAWRSQELRLIAQSMAQRRHAACRAGDRRARIRSSPSVRRSAARSRPWATASSARSRAPASSKRWCRTKSPRSNAPTTTTRSASAACCKDLANQRDTLVGQAEQVRNAITSVHLDLTQDMSTISDLVGQQVNEAAQTHHPVAHREGRAHHARARPRRRQHDAALGERGGDLLERLETASEETSRAIADASDRSPRA